MISAQCLNCGSSLQEDYGFCPACGQNARLHRLSMHEITHELVHYFTHADKGFFQLLKALAVKTGTVGREYVSGKRKKYFPALNFYLLVAAIYVLVTGLETNYSPPSNLEEQKDISRITNPVRRERVRKIYARRTEAVGFMNKYSNFVAMAAMPLIAFLFWLFYRKEGYNYTEHLVSGMYMVGFANLVYVLVMVPVSIILKTGSSYYSILFLFLFQTAYYSVYYYHFINRRTRQSLFKALGVSALVIISWMVLTTSLMSIYIMTGF